MSALLDQLAYRVKAVLAGTFIALTGVAVWAVTNPDTAQMLQQFVPAEFAPAVPVILGAVGVLLVNFKANAANPVDTSAVAAVDPDMNTTILTAINARNSGEFTGVGAQ